MAVINNSNQSKDRTPMLQACFDEKKLSVLKPVADKPGETEFRPIPEVDQDGNFVPMIRAMTPSGPDFSNIIIEEIVTNTGREGNKWTGICRASDSDATDPINMIFPGLFINLRSRQKKGTLPPGPATDKINEVLEERPIQGRDFKSRIMQRTDTLGFIQGVGISFQGVVFDKLRPRSAMMLTKTALTSLNNLLADCEKKGIDIFSPTDGYTLKFKGNPKGTFPGQTVPVMTVELGRKFPLPADKCKVLWTPWNEALKLRTTEEHIKQACKCFGREVVEAVYPDEVAQYVPEARVVVTVAKTAQQSKPATPPPASVEDVNEELQLTGASLFDDGVPPPLDGDMVNETPAAPPAKVAAKAPESVVKAGQTPEELKKQIEALLG